jgi:predicted RNA-binding Zn ribbon-like protein
MPRSQPPVDKPWSGAIPYTVSPYLCIEFVNSRFANYTGSGEVYDRLELARWRSWLLERAQIPVTEPPTPATLEELRQVRTELRQLLTAGGPPDPAAVTWINDRLAAAPTVTQLRRSGDHLRLQTTWQADWTAVIAAVLSSYGRLLQDGASDRVRECANPHCTWLFYDESRNASRRWCDPHACGNLHNVHAHRRRSRTKPATSPET